MWRRKRISTKLRECDTCVDANESIQNKHLTSAKAQDETCQHQRADMVNQKTSTIVKKCSDRQTHHTHKCCTCGLQSSGVRRPNTQHLCDLANCLQHIAVQRKEINEWKGNNTNTPGDNGLLACHLTSTHSQHSGGDDRHTDGHDGSENDEDGDDGVTCVCMSSGVTHTFMTFVWHHA